MNYFVHDKRDLSRAYVKRCRAFLNSCKLQARKPQASSSKRHNMARFI